MHSATLWFVQSSACSVAHARDCVQHIIYCPVKRACIRLWWFHSCYQVHVHNWPTFLAIQQYLALAHACMLCGCFSIISLHLIQQDIQLWPERSIEISRQCLGHNPGSRPKRVLHLLQRLPHRMWCMFKHQLGSNSLLIGKDPLRARANLAFLLALALVGVWELLMLSWQVAWPRTL